jgi:hypothetical protein
VAGVVYGTWRCGVTVLQLNAHTTGASLEFIRTIDGAGGPIALLPDEGGQDTILFARFARRGAPAGPCIWQMALDGTSKRTFGDDQYDYLPGEGIFAIAVLAPSREVAVSDFDQHRVLIFDNKGQYKRQIGTCGMYPNHQYPEDGDFFLPMGLASDAHGNLLVVEATGRTDENHLARLTHDQHFMNDDRSKMDSRLQVFSSTGVHLCTRNDIGLFPGPGGPGGLFNKHIAWGANGHLAIATSGADSVRVWRN